MDEPNTDWDGAVGVEPQRRHLLKHGEYPHSLELPDVEVWRPNELAELPREVDERQARRYVETTIRPRHF